MSHDVPGELRFLETHEWARQEDDRVRIGISDFAQDELGDVVFVELPDEGSTLEQDTAFGVVESIKAVSDIYAPVGGTVVAVNEELLDRPELINDDPYGDGWMVDLDPADLDQLDDLLDAEAYRDQIA